MGFSLGGMAATRNGGNASNAGGLLSSSPWSLGLRQVSGDFTDFSVPPSGPALRLSSILFCKVLSLLHAWASARYLGKRKLYDLKIDETNVRLNRSVELNETDTSRRRSPRFIRGVSRTKLERCDRARVSSLVLPGWKLERGDQASVLIFHPPTHPSRIYIYDLLCSS